MAYQIELGPGSSFSLHNHRLQTIATLASSSPGQQQQSSCSFATGNWQQTPAAFRNEQGVWIVVYGKAGTLTLQIQHNHITACQGNPDLRQAQRLHLQPLSDAESPETDPVTQPLPPLLPLTMQLGDMAMSMSPMQMRMGNLTMDINQPLQPLNAQSTEGQRFCTQCGELLQAGDRFCGSCGHKL